MAQEDRIQVVLLDKTTFGSVYPTKTPTMIYRILIPNAKNDIDKEDFNTILTKIKCFFRPFNIYTCTHYKYSTITADVVRQYEVIEISTRTKKILPMNMVQDFIKKLESI